MSHILPLFVGLTSLPSRLPLIRKTLDSLLAQTHVPDLIFLSLPRQSQRENSHYDIPDWLLNYDSRLIIIRCDEDYGPGTKLIGCIDHIREPACLILADDDMIYREFFLDSLYTAQCKDLKSSFSFWTYQQGPVTVGQGADGFSFFTPNIDGIESFANTILLHPHLRLVDDLWISAFLMTHGIAVQSVRNNIPDCKDIYEHSHLINQLHLEEGESQRSKIMQLGVQTLMKHGYLGFKYRMKYYAKQIALPFLPTRQKP